MRCATHSRGASVRPSRRRGFAMLTALAALVVVAASILAITALMVADARRTARAGDEAQLRELLMAGAVVADGHARLWPDRPPGGRTDVPLPPELAAGGGSLRIEIAPDPAGEGVEVRVVAAAAGRSQRQVLRYAREDGAWRLAGAELGPAGTVKQ